MWKTNWARKTSAKDFLPPVCFLEPCFFLRFFYLLGEWVEKGRYSQHCLGSRHMGRCCPEAPWLQCQWPALPVFIVCCPSIAAVGGRALGQDRAGVQFTVLLWASYLSWHPITQEASASLCCRRPCGSLQNRTGWFIFLSSTSLIKGCFSSAATAKYHRWNGLKSKVTACLASDENVLSAQTAAFLVCPHVGERKPTPLSSSSHKDSIPSLGVPPSWLHPNLITS